jgi:predicted metalloprotease with PDZ domain
MRRLAFVLVCVAPIGGAVLLPVIHAQRGDVAIRYRVSFPEPQHRWMQVEASFPGLGRGPLELRMSRSSPGRYSLHDFAKNVYDVHAFAAGRRELEATRPDPYGWTVSGHGGTVTVEYKVFGDRVDGTYLAIDTTHAHINMPAAFMWARGLEDRPITMLLEQPAGAPWRVATQLHNSGILTAPNLQYFMDSPIEFGAISLREFGVGGSRFRFAMHHTGTDAELDGLVKDVEKIVQQEGAIYGEYPQYEPGYYTFLADYLPYASGDGMEHRNSTVMTGTATIASDRMSILDTVAHEFFHCWNVERIRPKSLEPFDFDRANISGELWLSEGFTQYYGPLVLQRAGLVEVASTARTLTGLVEAVSGPGRLVRSAEETSRMAAFIDDGRSVDKTNWSISVTSYYPFGGAIALALDLTLRDRSGGRLSLDDFMRAMWRAYGKPGGSREGYVDRPYTSADAEETLASVSGDRAFARDFFGRFIQGHDVADYARLLARAGFVVRKKNAGSAWLGDLRLDRRNGVRVGTLIAPSWPVYRAGLDQGDLLQMVDSQPIREEGDLSTVLGRHKPGDSVSIVFTDRTGKATTAAIALTEDPHVEIVPVESGAGVLTDAQKAFRREWLGAK